MPLQNGWRREQLTPFNTFPTNTTADLGISSPSGENFDPRIPPGWLLGLKILPGKRKGQV